MTDDCARAEMIGMISAWRALVTRWDLPAYLRVDLLGMGYDFLEDPVPVLTMLGEQRMRILIEIDRAVQALYPRDEDLRAWLVDSREFGIAPIEKMAGALADLREVRSFMEDLASPQRRTDD